MIEKRVGGVGVNTNKIVRLLRQYGLPLLVLLLLAAFLFYSRGRVQTGFPVLTPQDGVVDARDADFDAEVYHIVNRWDYYPGVLLTPEELASPDAPQKDNDAPRDQRLGTWRVILLAEPETYLSLCSFSIDYGTRVFVDGREVRNIGYVSDDLDEAVPLVRYVTLPLYTGADGRVEIVYQYSNFFHNEGGFIQNTLISTPENIDEYQRALTFWSLLLGGGLAFFAFYFLLGAAFQKSWAYAALALCCAVIALRNHFFFGEYLLGAGYDFPLHYRLSILVVSLIPASSLCLLQAFFPQVSAGHRRLRLSFAVGFAALILCHFLLPLRSLVLLCHVCYYFCAPFLLLFILLLVRHSRKQPLTRLDVMTLAAMALLTVMLIWEGVRSENDSAINHFGVTPLTMIICILILDVVVNTRLKEQAALLLETRQRNELLGQVNEMNRDFLRMVAHELKTPLTVISGYAQLMSRQLEKGKLSDSAPERLETIRQEADRLADIVMRLMDYTYGRSGEAELTRVELRPLFESAGAVLTPVCARRGNTLRFADGAGLSVHGNFELLLQVLINLTVNASRHTENGMITVEAEDCGKAVAFRVRDNGEGIAPEAVPRIFEKGYSTTEGRGLGLAICSETVALHGGTLELESTGPTGSCFRFTIPKEDEA